MEKELLDKYDRIASMVAMGVPDTQIAEAVALSPGRISQIKDDTVFQEMLAAKYAARMEENAQFDSSWDSVEKQSLKVLNDTLKYNRNPEFALKVAMVANKAQRRGQQNVTLPTHMGDRVVINLNASFVGKLQQINTGQVNVEQRLKPVLLQDSSDNDMKKVNMLAPGQVDTLLNKRPTVLSADDINLDLSNEELEYVPEEEFYAG